MRRRRFLSGLASAWAAWAIAARAQETSPRIGFVYTGPKSVVASRIEAISRGLRESGLPAPLQVEFIIRATDGDPSRIVPLIDEVIASKVNVFIAVGPAALRAARAKSPTIPIVAIDLESEPLEGGIAQSLAHPGGNTTGIFMDFPDFTPKFLQLLAETSTGLSRVAILWDPTIGPVQLDAVKRAASALKVDLDVFEARRSSDFEKAFSTADQRGIRAMIVLSSPLIPGNVQTLSELALRYRVAAVTLFPDFARVGGLLAYGPNLLDLIRQVGVMSGKIIQGAKPGDLPIERPSKFELVLNLKTAKALDLTIAPGLLLRADEVIE
jgi:putative ABC transport system substrate-binding protein